MLLVYSKNSVQIVYIINNPVPNEQIIFLTLMKEKKQFKFGSNNMVSKQQCSTRNQAIKVDIKKTKKVQLTWVCIVFSRNTNEPFE